MTDDQHGLLSPELASKDVLTVAEVVRYSRIGRNTVYAAIDSGQLPAIRVGRILRVKRSDAIRWFQGLRDAGTPRQ